MKHKTRHITIWSIVTVCRLLLAGTLVFSGFVKAVDPIGMLHKINAYFTHWGLHFPSNSLTLKVLVISLSTAEFILGIYLLLGMRRRFTTVVTLSFIAVMTLLTLLINIYNPVPDCGCFGEAITLTNEQTLGKNIILLCSAIICFAKKKYMLRLISERNQWITSLYSWAYIILLGLYSLHYLPSIDFTPFKTGVDIKKAYYSPDSLTPASLASFDCFDKYGNPITETLLNEHGFTFLLTLPDIRYADDGCNDRINDIYDACQDSNYHFYGLANINADSMAINKWIDLTGATYPILTADPNQINAMVRSNPGLLLLHNGKIIEKWSNNNLPVITTEGKWTPSQNKWLADLSYIKLILWFILPLLIIITLDRIWIGSKLFKHYIFTKRLNKTIMRKKIVAGNWKMNLNLQDGIALAKDLNTALTADKPNCDVVICTPFIHLASVANEIDSNIIGLGAENCADKSSGAYTGEVSAEMVKSTGAQYVILGHSERRAYYNETPEILKEKINLALANGLKVIFCIGEVLEERESGKQSEVVKSQLEGSLFDLSVEEFKNIILAYEPVWAIGTGKTASAEQAEEMHAFIRSAIAEKFGNEAAENVSILYGGSCKPSNAKEIFAKANVDGGLIGGAALKVADFKGIIDAWK